jgi:hypothetical protein
MLSRSYIPSRPIQGRPSQARGEVEARDGAQSEQSTCAPMMTRSVLIAREPRASTLPPTA